MGIKNNSEGFNASSEFVIVKKQPGKKRQKALIYLLLFIVLLGLGAVANYWFFGQLIDQTQQKNRDLTVSLKDISTQLSKAERDLSMLKTAKTIDDQSSVEVQHIIQDLTLENAELRENIDLYKEIMAAKGRHRLVIQSWGVSPVSGKSEIYKYKLVLAQFASNNEYIEGEWTLSVKGIEDSKIKSYPFSELSAEKDSTGFFGFQYLQRFSGEIRLPDRFQPSQVHIKVKPKGRRARQVEKGFEWQVLERGDYVEKNQKS